MPESFYIDSDAAPRVAIACGGTGGHLFPGMAVGQALLERGCEVTLIISPKEVDQQAVKSASGMTVETLPAVGLTADGFFRFLAGFWKSYSKSKAMFKLKPPHVVLGMGGFTSAPPMLAGRRLGARTFLHESNTIPGRANSWLARGANGAFVYFPETVERLSIKPKAEVTGMPVRSQFLEPIDPEAARMALGLDPKIPLLLVMGGSQGASKLNDLVVSALPKLAQCALQIIHLTGARDFDKVKAAYAACQARGMVRAFLSEMDLALGAADVAISRAGASSLAELAALRVPAVLIPLPSAADNHQFHNARAFVQSGAALMVEQAGATAELLASQVLELLQPARRAAMQQALSQWHSPEAAAKIAEKIIESVPGTLQFTHAALGRDPA